MALFDTKARKVVEFGKAAQADGLAGKMHPDKRSLVEAFIQEYLDSQAPAQALRDYHLKMAPLEVVFERTRALAKAVIALLEGWSLAAGNGMAVQAETGAWLLGEDEADDLARLEKFHGAFVKFYGSGGLPAALKADELRKQAAAHHKAAGEMPKLPPGQQLSTLQASHRDLTASCNAAFEAFHDFLDGYFGKKGDQAYAEKAKYGYDRRAGKYRVATKTGAGSTEGAGTGAGTGDSQTAPAKEAARS